MTVVEPRRLLAVLAHPDDESFGIGGTLALYARRGVAVHLLCATRGEAGAAPPESMQGYAELGALREAELRCAAEQLALRSVRFLDYRDSGMPGSPDNHHPAALAAAPLDQVVERVTAALRRVRPQVVVTFDPFGGYGHPDHIAVHNATVRAFEAAGRPDLFPEAGAAFRPDRLYFHTFPRRALRILITLMRLTGRDPRRWGRNGDIDLAGIAAVDFPIHAWVDVRSVLEVRRRAAACHASQGGASGGRVVGWMTRLLAGRESFTRAAPPPPPRLRERDLFEGLAPADAA